jgi:hypothetical protein
MVRRAHANATVVVDAVVVAVIDTRCRNIASFRFFCIHIIFFVVVIVIAIGVVVVVIVEFQ